MKRPLTLAMTETQNVYEPMPQQVSELSRLSAHLEEIRRANVAHHVALARVAAARGAQIIGFGELFTGPYFASTQDPMWLGLAESAEDGPTVQTLKTVAQEESLVIVAPIYERHGERRYNTAVVIDADGQVLGKYRKTHIPNGQNEQGRFTEGFYYDRADAPQDGYFPVFKTRYAQVGVAICYDRHFEGVMSALKRHGAELILSPAVTFGAKSERLWDMEFEVDAVRHRVFIAGSNRLGAELPWGVRYFGKSYVAGPNSRPPLDRSTPGLVMATIDLGELDAPDAAGWRLLEDARPDIYRE